MRQYFLTFILLSCSTLLLAQHSTRNFTNESFSLNNQSILLIPFETDLYLSDANPVIARHNNMETSEIIERFRKALDQNILQAFENCTVNSFYTMDEDSAKNTLKYIRRNIKFEYELVPKDNRESTIKTLSNKLNKKPKDQYGRGIKDGQVVSKRDERERYMKAIVTDNNMIDSLTGTFGVDYFIFITELDFNNIYTPEMHLGSTDNERELKLHYTIYRKDGLMLSTGISKTNMPSSVTNINQIISKYFPVLTKQIYQDLVKEESRKKHIIEH